MKGSSRYCKKCKRKTPVMFYEGGEYCMYCQEDYDEQVEEKENEDERENKELDIKAN